jgi:hypothetical protein
MIYPMAHANQMAALLVGAALVLATIVVIVGLRRIRATRRFEAAVDAYAQREMYRNQLQDRQLLGDLPPGDRALPPGSAVGP